MPQRFLISDLIIFSASTCREVIQTTTTNPIFTYTSAAGDYAERMANAMLEKVKDKSLIAAGGPERQCLGWQGRTINETARRSAALSATTKPPSASTTRARRTPASDASKRPWG